MNEGIIKMVVINGPIMRSGQRDGGDDDEIDCRWWWASNKKQNKLTFFTV